MGKSDLPFGSEFSPAQIRLPQLLELAEEHGGDWKAFEAAVRKEYFENYKTSDYNRGKLADNTKLSMIAYGLVDRDARLTDLGKSLYAIRDDEGKLYAEFGKHILLNLNGMNLVQCIRDIQASGETVTLLNLREWLDERGVHFPRGGKHASTMRLWLEKAEVFSGGWTINEAKVKELSGATLEEFDELAVFSPEQRAYIRTLANMDGLGTYPSNEVEKLAATTYGVKYNEKNLPKQVLYPLESAGYVTLTRGTKEAGRGAKPFLVTPTDILVDKIVLPLLGQLERQVAPGVYPLLRKPMAEILEELDSDDKHLRGLALEALAFKLMRLVDMRYVATRLRGDQTGGAEVDLIFESSRLVFSRWQIQCKNSSRVSLDDVAKEVGLTHLLKSNVIVMVGTGQIGGECRRYANKIMSESSLCIVMVDHDDLTAIRDNPPSIADVFHREAEHAMAIKKLEI
ncbi:MAG: restriction endonuclease [Actinobacteria bacterium]|nr:restriction endonuclease [Actinomycetota bacterium]